MTNRLFIVGASLCFFATCLNQTGNILMKLNQMKLDTNPKYAAGKIQYVKWGGVACWVIGSASDTVSLLILPLSVWAAIIPSGILVATMLAHFVAGEKASRTVWTLLVLLTLSVFAMIQYGTKRQDIEVLDHISERLSNSPSTLLFVSSFLIVYILLVIFEAFSFRKRKHAAEESGTAVLKIPHPCELYNIAGPIIASATSTLVSASIKMVFAMLSCSDEDDTDDCDFHPAFFIMAPLLVLWIVILFKAMKFMMSFLEIITAVPIFQVLLILFLNLWGIILFDERPEDWVGYGCAMLTSWVLIVIVLTMRGQSQSHQMERRYSLDSLRTSIDSLTNAIEIELASKKRHPNGAAGFPKQLDAHPDC